ncbi:hypothetical protein GOODEAATRI_000754, partial [Goodea atripinnis]
GYWENESYPSLMSQHWTYFTVMAKGFKLDIKVYRGRGPSVITSQELCIKTWYTNLSCQPSCSCQHRTAVTETER